MSKKIVFGGKPPAHPIGPDAWVEQRVLEAPVKAEAMKRLTFDVPESLHRRIKSQCASQGIKMTDALRALLDEHFPAQD